MFVINHAHNFFLLDSYRVWTTSRSYSKCLLFIANWFHGANINKHTSHNKRQSHTETIITNKCNVSEVFSHGNFLRSTLIDSELSMHVNITGTKTNNKTLTSCSTKHRYYFKHHSPKTYHRPACCNSFTVSYCIHLVTHRMMHTTHKILTTASTGETSANTKLGLASISFWSRSDRWLYCARTVDQKQDWSWSWT